ncbi:hypothetical protein C4564_02020 [Candidatus Microgenomates bacterium]|nr:MAG: hypothetical protein C4564_02020 [Candidatus Microgenomates bacterium]
MKKRITSLLIVVFTLSRVALPVAVIAADVPEKPQKPTTAETTEQAEETTETQGTQEPESTVEPQDTSDVQEEPQSDAATEEPKPSAPATGQGEVTTPQTYGDDSGSATQNGEVGDVEIKTGDAQANGAIVNNGNINIEAQEEVPEALEDESAVSIVNEENGAGSQNTGMIAEESTNTTNQDNSATLDNNLNASANSGANSASKNVGNSSIKTGDAVASGTITNMVNNNLSGVTVSEFNVIEDYVGDLELDFEANCVLGCDGQSVNIENNNNGEDSINTGEVNSAVSDELFQTNEIVLENNLTLEANTGENAANKNTGGDTSIETGDATVVGNILNILNNNFAGNVLYGVVNIIGDLTGDIILSEEQAGKLFANNVNLENISNGANSTNNASSSGTEDLSYYQFNSADIVNNIDIEANTGENLASGNTNGNNQIDTGNANVDVNVINIANNNFLGGNWWLVLVNEAGNWVGRLISVPEASMGDNVALSQGLYTSQEGQGVNVVNNGNGEESMNTGVVNQSKSGMTSQINNATVVNNASLSANSGRNSASKNTGGVNNIETGDANATLNLVNFVNNNFAGGNVFITVVNVFGSWIGDFVTPGAVKAEEETGVGGVSEIPGASSSSENNSSNSGSSGSSSSDSGSPTSTTTVLGSSVSHSRNTRVAFSSTTSGLSEGNETPVLALGNTDVAGASDTKEKLKINLAWALLAFPLIVILRIAKNRFSGN